MEIDFNSVFASGAHRGELLDFPSADYIRGWGYLGKNVAPPMEFFNCLQNISDEKDLYLYKTKADRSEIPRALKSPYPIVIKYDNKDYEYDGSQKIIINIDLATEAEIIAIVEG